MKRKAFLQTVNANSKKVLVLTEGVLPYLSEEQVAELAEDLHAQVNIRFWIMDYLAPELYRYLQTKERAAKMKNAPFRFFPADRFEFFSRKGWKVAEIAYAPEVAQEAVRPSPRPWWMVFVVPFLSKETREKIMKSSGYMVMERKA